MVEALTAGAVSRDLAGRAMVYLKARCTTGCATRRDSGRSPGCGRRSSATATWPASMTCSPGWSGPRTATTTRLTATRASTGRSSALPHLHLPTAPAPAQVRRPLPGNAEDAAAEANRTPATANDEDPTGGDQVSPQSLGEALKQAVREQREGELEQLKEDVDLQTLLKAASKPEAPIGRGRGTGMPTGRLPDRGVDRPPMADEVQMARQ